MLFLLIGCGCTFLLLFFLPKQDVGAKWDGVYRSELSDISVSFFDPDRGQTFELSLSHSRPSFVVVKGRMKGASTDDFAKFSVLGNLFRIQIGDDAGPVWRSYPSRVNVSPDGLFQFEVPVMVRKSTRIGRYDMICSIKSHNGERRELNRMQIKISR